MTELDRAAITGRIAKAREESGLKQHELADVMDVHVRTVQNWESKAHPIVPWERLGEIADVTGVSREWILRGEHEEGAVSRESLLSRLEDLEALTATGFRALESAIGQLTAQLRPPGQADGKS